MNKNILIKVASLTLVAGVLLTSFGCKKGEEGTATTATPQTTGFSGVEQPVIENGTIVVEQTKKEESGSTVVEQKEQPAYYISEGKTLDQYNEKVKESIVSRHEELGIDKAKAEEMTKDGTSWTSVTVGVYIKNTNSQGSTMRLLKVNNTESVVVDTELSCEHGIPAGKGMYVSLDAYVDSSKIESQEEIVAALKTMDIQIAYTLIGDSTESVDDWSKVTTAYMPVNF